MRFEKVRLPAVTPERLGGYLKGLGLLRLAARARSQGTEPRAGWSDCLEIWIEGGRSAIDGLIQGLQPTAILNPWNRDCRRIVFGTGEAVGSDESGDVDPDEAAEAGADATDDGGVAAGTDAARARFDAEVWSLCEREARSLAHLDAQAREQKVAIDADDKVSNEEKKRRKKLLDESLERERHDTRRRLRAHLPDRDIEWLDALVVLLDVEDGKLFEASSLGAAVGCDGRNDFSVQFVKALRAIAQPSGLANLRASLGLPTEEPPEPVEQTGGQFASISVEAPNSGVDFQSKKSINPWELILVFEGLCAFSASAVRRLDLRSGSFPFSFLPNVESGPGLSVGEQIKQEIWLPLWSRPATYSEVRRLIADGRISRGRGAARDALGARLGLARLGAARGIDRFSRQALVVRNGKSCLAVPLGNVRVPRRAAPELELLEDTSFERWLSELRGAARAKNAPGPLADASGRVDRAILAVADGPSAHRWQTLFLAIAEAERTAARRGRPAPLVWAQRGDDTRWGAALDDGSRDLRLAAALAGLPGVRAVWLPLDPEKSDTWAKDRRVRVPSQAPADVQVADTLRACLTAHSSSARRPEADANVRHPLDGPCRVGPVEIRLWFEVDDRRRRRILDLARGLSTLHVAALPSPTEADRRDDAGRLDVAWWACRLALHPRVTPPDAPVPLSAMLTVATLLRVGRLREAVALAAHSLDVARLRLCLRTRRLVDVTPVQMASPVPFLSSLAFPFREEHFDSVLLPDAESDDEPIVVAITEERT